jgi:hypothetical protein
VLIDGTVYFDRDNEVSGRGAKQAEKQKIKIVILQPRRTATSPNVPGLFHSPQ